MVFVYDGANDLKYKISDKHLFDSTWPSEIEKIIKKIRNYYKTTHLIDYLDRVSQKKIFGDQDKKLEELSEEKIAEKVELWQERWEKICKSENMKDVQLVISIQPYLGVGNKDLADWEMMIKQTNKKTDVSEFYPVIINELETMDSNCAVTLDLTNVFDDYSETIFYDLMHVGVRGNEIVADRIYEGIIPVLKENIRR